MSASWLDLLTAQAVPGVKAPTGRRRITKLADGDEAEAKAHAERAAERMRKLHADPEFAKAHAERAAERMRKLNADPEFAAKNRKAVSDAQKKRWAKWRAEREAAGETA